MKVPSIIKVTKELNSLKNNYSIIKKKNPHAIKESYLIEK